ncbi:DNA mismatch repair endonuclease MutL [Haladaptatus pallidirubidus]|uniref:DNA mismatch repair protein MutL n=1 Tax=Haladaptatus pallidirubidus TaxID=1008152 RepID=A0AAV3URV1_9EURY|nr:DNA mismatch repair endonuclease MutL [Haladaptatus pallidirubidus]
MTDNTNNETRIQQLDKRTVRQIAAGEVVERPASVVKEFVENSIDADASRIQVTVEEGGTERITVSDDGHGMSETDVRMAVKEHTTSKITDITDLESGVLTLGFRGEALHTIGAVSRLTIKTKPRGSTDAGTKLQLSGGTVENVSKTGCPEGTTVEVDDLFYNTPARQKYLKTEATEFSHINTVVTEYALANPDIAFSLSHNGREVFSTTGQDNLQGTILSVYGKEVATSMIEINQEADELPDGTINSIRGFVSDPETTRSTREYMSTNINGRYVNSAEVRNAILSAYGNQLAVNRYPFVVIFLDIPRDFVDVNVHPRKMEVRFDDEDGICAQVRKTVENTLLEHGLIRTSAPRGRSAPGDTDITPSGEQSELVQEEGKKGSMQATESDTVSSNTATQQKGQNPSTESAIETSDDQNVVSSETDTTSIEAKTSSPPPQSGSLPSGDSLDSEPTPNQSDQHSRIDQTLEPDKKFSQSTEAATLDDDTETPEYENLPQMHVLGQLHETYVIAETPDGLVLVDQHAADERINYERLRNQFGGNTETQVLATPVTLELTAGEAALFDEYQDVLAKLGFHAGRTDGNESRTVKVTTVPTVFNEILEPTLLRDVIDEFISTDPNEREHTSVEAMADALLADLACYPSITGNTSLREGSIIELLATLDECENPYACPHGRPVIIEFNTQEIADRFERDYPGHANRRIEE